MQNYKQHEYVPGIGANETSTTPGGNSSTVGQAFGICQGAQAAGGECPFLKRVGKYLGTCAVATLAAVDSAGMMSPMPATPTTSVNPAPLPPLPRPPTPPGLPLPPSRPSLPPPPPPGTDMIGQIISPTELRQDQARAENTGAITNAHENNDHSDRFFKAASAYHERGLQVIPLQSPVLGDKDTGKCPLLNNWQHARLTMAEIRGTWKTGHTNPPNLGILTGKPSGVAVLDFDNPELFAPWAARHPEAAATRIVARNNAPPGRGHLYFLVPAGTAAPKSTKGAGWDLQSTGRQVVAPPSPHYSGGVYEWKDATAPLVPWNPAYLDGLPSPKKTVKTSKAALSRPSPQPVSAPQTSRYGRGALEAEVAAVRATTEGGRNARLNQAAFSMGQLIGGGEIDRPEVESVLLEAGLATGLGGSECFATIASGINAGMNTPRTAPPRTGGAVVAPYQGGKLPHVTIPSMFTDAGEGKAVTLTVTARELFKALALTGRFFLHCGRPSMLVMNKTGSSTFELLTKERFSAVVQNYVEIWRMDSDQGKPFSRPVHVLALDIAGRLLESEEAAEMLPPVVLVTAAPPLYEDADGRLCTMHPGYNPQNGGVYVTGTAPVPEILLAEAVATLVELLTDFDFVTPADKARILLGIISPAMRFAGLLRDHLPVLLLEANASQSGKNYLMAIIAGCYGERAAIETMKDEEDRGGVGSLREAVGNLLVSGRPFLALSNIRARVACQALEETLTPDGTYSFRLPYKGYVDVDPRCVAWILTTNNAEVTPDFAKRCSIVRIRKRPDNYVFRSWLIEGGSIKDYVAANWPRLLGCVYAVVKAWHAAGKPTTGEARHTFRLWAGPADWISQNILNAGPLLDGHQETQRRTSNTSLVFVRELALLVVNAPQPPGGRWRSAGLASLVEAHGMVVPGVKLGADENAAMQAVGRIMKVAFGKDDQLTVDEFTVTRQIEWNAARGKHVSFYVFTLTRQPPDPTTKMQLPPIPPKEYKLSEEGGAPWKVPAIGGDQGERQNLSTAHTTPGQVPRPWEAPVPIDQVLDAGLGTRPFAPLLGLQPPPPAPDQRPGPLSQDKIPILPVPMQPVDVSTTRSFLTL